MHPGANSSPAVSLGNQTSYVVEPLQSLNLPAPWPWTSQPPELWEMNFCCFKATQFVVFCSSSPSWLQQCYILKSPLPSLVPCLRGRNHPHPLPLFLLSFVSFPGSLHTCNRDCIHSSHFYTKCDILDILFCTLHFSINNIVCISFHVCIERASPFFLSSVR